MDDRAHLMPFGATGWSVWRYFALRAAGMPAMAIETLRAPELARMALDGEAGAYREAFGAWRGTLDQRLRRLAADEWLREALAWQNSTVVHNALDPVLRTGDTDRPVKPKHAQVIANYLQRYATKNDTIGFFGAACWGQINDLDGWLTVRPGPAMVGDRRVYFEIWAINAYAAALRRDPAAHPCLRPRLRGRYWLHGSTLIPSYGPAIELDDAQRELVLRCDGTHTLSEFDAAQTAALIDLEAHGAITVDWEVCVLAHPEARLRTQLELIPDEQFRQHALAGLDRLEDLRDQLARAGGDADAVLKAIGRLDTFFEEMTASSSTVHPGEMYAGRRIVYEDCTRDVAVAVGGRLATELVGSLGPLLQAGRWLIGRIADRYGEMFDSLHQRLAERSDDGTVSLARMVAAATSHLTAGQRTPALVTESISEFQAAWARVLPPMGDRALHITAGDLAAGIEREFPVTGAPPWSSARYIAPDLMIASPDAAHAADGDLFLVLGEMHLSMNTLEQRLFVERQPEIGWIDRAVQQDHAGRRVYCVPDRGAPDVSPRTWPTAVVATNWAYWTLGDGTSLDTPTPTIPGSALEVYRTSTGLRVRARPPYTGDFSLLETLDQQMTGVALNAFRPVPVQAHQPRITVDRLILVRESWGFDPAELGWTDEPDPSSRFRKAQIWRRDRGLPERCFWKVPTERKPVFLDFASTLLVDRFAKAVRQSAGAAGRLSVLISEMVPDLGSCWLEDEAGLQYTSELRFVFVLSPDA